MEPSAATASGKAEERPGGKRSSRSNSGFALDRERVDNFCEKAILGCILAITTFAPLATGATRPSHLVVLLGLATVLSGFWAVRLVIRDQYRFLWAPICWAIIVFVGYAGWQYWQADIEYYARREVLQIVLYAFIFFAILDNLHRQEMLQVILFTLIAVGMINAFYAIYQYFTESQKILWFAKPLTYKGRGSGTYVCPNHLAGFLEMLIPVALAYTFTGRLKPITKVFLGYAALAMIAGVGVTISRGGYIALAIGLLVFFGVLMWNRDYRIPAAIFLVLIAVVGSFFGYRSIQSQLRINEATRSERNMRKLYWQAAVDMWKENKWTGVGPNHYDWRVRKWRHWQLQGKPVYTHNDYLNTLADYGVIGLGLILTAIGLAGWGVIKTWKFVRRNNEIGSKGSNRSAVVLGCSAGLVAILAHSIPDFNMHIPANAIVAITLIAIVTTHLRFATERYWFNPGLAGRLVGALLVVAAGGIFAWQGTKLGLQSYYATHFTPPKTFAEQIDRLKRAYSYDEKNGDLAQQIGETMRKKAWQGDSGWRQLLEESMPWFERSIQLNKWNPYGYANLGMAYHWLKEHEKAAEYFDKALALDPNGFYVLALFGWHKLQIGELEEARKYFQTSFSYKWWDNEFAKKYLDLIERRLAEQTETR